MHNKELQATPEQSINNIIDCFTNGKTKGFLKNDFEIVSSKGNKENDEKLCNFFVEKANDSFFEKKKSIIKEYFDILCQSKRSIYYYTAFLLSSFGIYSEEEGKKYYKMCLDSKFLPSILYESEHLAKTEKSLSTVFDFCSNNTNSIDGSLEFNFGVLTYFGLGTNEDQQTGKQFLEKSASKAYDSAIVILAAICEKENQEKYTEYVNQISNKKIVHLNFKSYFLTEASKRLWLKISHNETLRPLFDDFEMMMIVSKNPQFLELASESKLSEISERLFENDLNLTSIFIPSHVKKINRFAFKNCLNLVSIEFAPNSNLKEIGEESFFNCIGISSIELPKSVKIIEKSSFENNKSLSKLILNEGIKSISKKSFFNCTSLKMLSIPSSLENLGEASFADCDMLDFLEFKNDCHLDFIGDYAFQHAGIQKVDFPESITKTGIFSFNYCQKLTSVSFKNIVTIGKGTFHTCKQLSTVEIEKNTLKDIGDGSFYACPKLSVINLKNPSNLETIGKCCFQNCISLENFNFENVKFISELSFYGCNSLIEINIPGSVKVIDDESFEACENLKNVIIGDGVEIIGERCFYECTSIEKVNLPKSLKEIRSLAFNGCINLFDINIINDSVKIGENAFGNCPKLTIKK